MKTGAPQPQCCEAKWVLGLSSLETELRQQAEKKRNIYLGPFVDPIIFQKLDKGIENGENPEIAREGEGEGDALANRGELSHVAQDLKGQMFASPKSSFLIPEGT